VAEFIKKKVKAFLDNNKKFMFFLWIRVRFILCSSVRFVFFNLAALILYFSS
jgi:hypothetical protein